MSHQSKRSRKYFKKRHSNEKRRCGDMSIAELQSKVDEYFSNITDEQLEEDCKKANIDFYSTIKTRIFS